MYFQSKNSGNITDCDEIGILLAEVPGVGVMANLRVFRLVFIFGCELETPRKLKWN